MIKKLDAKVDAADKEKEHKNLVYGSDPPALLIFVYLMECVTRKRRPKETRQGGKGDDLAYNGRAASLLFSRSSRKWWELYQLFNLRQQKPNGFYGEGSPPTPPPPQLSLPPVDANLMKHQSYIFAE